MNYHHLQPKPMKNSPIYLRLADIPSELPVGASHWWGYPDLPEDMPIPTVTDPTDGNTYALNFICQINLADLPEGIIRLPHSGLLLFFALSSMPAWLAALAVMAGDPFCKMVSSQVVSMMPYARTEDEAKSGVVYRKVTVRAGLLLFVQGMLPLALLLYVTGGLLRWDVLIFGPCLVMYFMYLYIWHRLRGYTGDCCGAMFLLTELSFYLCMSYLYFNNNALWRLF